MAGYMQLLESHIWLHVMVTEAHVCLHAALPVLDS
jgi:hypothetical protein